MLDPGQGWRRECARLPQCPFWSWATGTPEGRSPGAAAAAARETSVCSTAYCSRSIRGRSSCCLPCLKCLSTNIPRKHQWGCGEAGHKPPLDGNFLPPPPPSPKICFASSCCCCRRLVSGEPPRQSGSRDASRSSPGDDVIHRWLSCEMG